MSKKVSIRTIIDVAGKPASLVEKTLQKVTEELENNEKLQILEIITAEPELQDEKSGMYTAFLELEIEFVNVREAMKFIVDYLPTSIEIIEPFEIKVSNEQLTDVLNDMAHFQIKNINEIHRLKAHNHILQKHIKELEDKFNTKK